MRRLILVTVGSLLGASCHTQASTPGALDERSPAWRWPYASSEEFAQAGDPDTIYIRRMRTFEQLVRQVNTDSLVKLYVGSLDATTAQAPMYQQAVYCQYSILIRRYGDSAPRRAIQLMTDSLFPTPAARRRWAAAWDRWPSVLGPHACELTSIPAAPDSLSWQPYKERRS